MIEVVFRANNEGTARAMNNLYKILDVPKDSSQEVIKKAFHKKARELHPDKKNGDVEKMQETTQAYWVLKDPKRRKFYDQTGEVQMSENNTLMSIAMELVELFVQTNPKNTTKWLKDVQKKSKENFEQVLEKFENEKIKYQELQSRIIKTPVKDFLGLSLEDKISKANTHIEKLKKEYDVRLKVFKMFKEYELKDIEEKSIESRLDGIMGTGYKTWETDLY